MRVLVLLVSLVLTACGRPLSDAEKSFAKQIHGDEVNTRPIRIYNDAPLAAVTRTRQVRPRLTCRERIFPEPTGETFTSSPSAVVIHSKLFFTRDWHQQDFLPDYPQRFDLVEAMLFAHEITHVWQWQNRRKTGYSLYRAASEHTGGNDPYLFDIATEPDLLSYPYEQQASIVEEYVCCAALDPHAPRTKRLETMLSGAFPLQDLRIPDEIILPWRGVQVEGICNPDRVEK